MSTDEQDTLANDTHVIASESGESGWLGGDEETSDCQASLEDLQEEKADSETNDSCTKQEEDDVQEEVDGTSDYDVWSSYLMILFYIFDQGSTLIDLS